MAKGVKQATGASRPTVASTEVIYYDGAWQVTTDAGQALRAIEVTYDAKGCVVRRRPINLKKFATLSTDPRARAVMLGQDHH